MADPSFVVGPISVSTRRSTEITFDCYDADGSALVVDVADNVRFKLWSTDDASPLVDADIGGATSEVIIDDYGTVGTTPARVRVIIDEADTASLSASTAYKFELILVDNSDSDRNKTICRGDATAYGTATGSTGP